VNFHRAADDGVGQRVFLHRVDLTNYFESEFAEF
jgi:hypothetical protein